MEADFQKTLNWSERILKKNHPEEDTQPQVERMDLTKYIFYIMLVFLVIGYIIWYWWYYYEFSKDLIKQKSGSNYI